MRLDSSISDILDADLPAAFNIFGRQLDATWIAESLSETGTATIRRRKLPASLVVWLVIGMGLFRDRSIQEVVGHLGLVLPSKNSKGGVGRKVAPSAIPQARSRLGEAPLKEIFKRTARVWGEAAANDDRWQGLSLYGADGTSLRVADTPENSEHFGRWRGGRGDAAYPQVRLVALMALRSHVMSAVAFGPYIGKSSGEHSLMNELWPKVPVESLVILDRGFLAYGPLYRLSNNIADGTPTNKHWLVRSKKNLRWKTLKIFGKGDELVEITLTRNLRLKDPELPKTIIVRAVQYQVKGFQPQMLLTSLTDAERFPGVEIAALYHERWEIELAYDEVKTHMLERQEALRSKTPEGVRQEIWGILIAYNLVRKEILDVASAAKVSPLRISFRHTLMLTRVFCTVEAWACAPGNLPKRLAERLDTLASLLILPKRRPTRSYPRHVKIKMSGYNKNPGQVVVGDQNI